MLLKGEQTYAFRFIFKKEIRIIFNFVPVSLKTNVLIQKSFFIYVYDCSKYFLLIKINEINET